MDKRAARFAKSNPEKILHIDRPRKEGVCLGRASKNSETATVRQVQARNRMTEVFEPVRLTWVSALVIILIFGFAPRLLTRILSFAFPKDDPRREELVGEVDAIPYRSRPFFVAEQLEVALIEGIGGRLRLLWIKNITYRWSLGDGVMMNNQHPDSFHIPNSAEKSSVKIGDHVKISFITRVGEGERIWVRVTKISPRGFTGRIDNDPIVVPGLRYGKKIRFRSEHIIDIVFASDVD